MALIDDLFALITTSSRSFSTLIPDVVLREVNKDELIVTDHPVERGAAISDHAFMRPLEVDMQMGWSDSTGGVGYCQEIYQELVALQQEREPFEITTGKRSYENMLLVGITVQTEPTTENVLMVSGRFREIIIVETETTSAPASAQASPSKTQPTTDVGAKQLKSSGTSGFASPTARA
jgi:hypothetical protein